jgi:deazaflavin-dependent oxidoreductase (nitroreductase family)
MRTLLQSLGGLGLVGLLALVAFTVSFRTKFRPVQDVIRRFNRDVTNPRQLASAGGVGAWASVVHHVGRASGTAYRTPVVAVEVDDGFLFALPYGPGADWVRNVLAAGSATLEHEGRAVTMDHPVLVDRTRTNPFFARRERLMHRLYGVDDFLHVRSPAAE